MGSPKALLSLRGRTFLERIIDIYESARISQVIVLGRNAAEITERVHPYSGRILVNPDPSRGPLSSLLIALQEVSETDAFILHPVDHPVVRMETVQSLAGIHERLPGCILIPDFRGRRGHPVLIPRKFYADLRSAPLSEGARWAVRSNRTANHIVEVSDPGVLMNIDTQDAYAQLTGYPKLYCIQNGKSEDRRPQFLRPQLQQ